MISLKITVESAKTVQALEGMTQPLRRQTQEAIGTLLVDAAKINIDNRSGPTGAAWPSGPWTEMYAGKRTWEDIRRSLAAVPVDNGVVMGATHVAAAVRHYGTRSAGGTMPDIVPTKKKALTIPISEEASRASYQGKDARSAFPDAFLLTKDGRHGASPLTLGVIARKVGGRKNRKTGVKENQTLDLLYLLTRRVAIRPHPFMPVDRDGKLAPVSLGTRIDELVINNFLGGNQAAGVAA